MRARFPAVVRRIKGHGMVPVLPPGTKVIGISWLRPKVRDIVIIEHDGKEMVRRIQQILGDGSFFVVGEHMETSRDSRHFGAIDPSQVIAKVVWPSVRKD